MPASSWDGSMFPSRVDLLRTTTVPSPMGTPKQTTTTLASSVHCSIQPLDPQDAGSAIMAIQSGVDTLVYFPADPDVQPDDRIKDLKGGRTFRVLGTVNQDDEDDLWAVHCKAVTSNR